MTAEPVVALRLEGPEPSVVFRCQRLLAELALGSDAAVLDREAALDFWQSVRDVEPFAALPDRVVWRISVAPARGAEIGMAIARALDALWYLDWGGGLVWAAVADAEDGGAEIVRAAIRGTDGQGRGHATLIRGPAALRQMVPVFEPQPAALAALGQRIKEAFDPHHILNPGRMAERSR